MLQKNAGENGLNERKKLEKKAELKKQIRNTHSESVTKRIMQWYKPLKKTNKKQAPTNF